MTDRRGAYSRFPALLLLTTNRVELPQHWTISPGRHYDIRAIAPGHMFELAPEFRHPVFPATAPGHSYISLG